LASETLRNGEARLVATLCKAARASAVRSGSSTWVAVGTLSALLWESEPGFRLEPGVSIIESVLGGCTRRGGCADGDPLGQLAFGAQVVAVNVQPALDRAAFPFHRPCVGRREETVGACGIDPHKEPALTARRHCYLAGDEERESSEHCLLGHRRAARQQLPSAVSEMLVVRHWDSLFRWTSRWSNDQVGLARNSSSSTH